MWGEHGFQLRGFGIRSGDSHSSMLQRPMVAGVLLLVLSATFFATTMSFMFYTTFVTAEAGTDFLEDARYYSYLLPLLLPVTFAAVFINWVSMKFFRHN